MKPICQEITALIRGGYPLIYILSFQEPYRLENQHAFRLFQTIMFFQVHHLANSLK